MTFQKASWRKSKVLPAVRRWHDVDCMTQLIYHNHQLIVQTVLTMCLLSLRRYNITHSPNNYGCDCISSEDEPSTTSSDVDNDSRLLGLVGLLAGE